MLDRRWTWARPGVAMLALAIAGCGGGGGGGDSDGGGEDAAADSGSTDGGGTDAGGMDGGGADAGGTDASADATAGADSGIVCTADGADRSFPDFDKSCSGAEDCDYGLHQTDCCGNQIALGFNASESGRFDDAESICRDMYPACGCPAGPIETEAGGTTVSPDAIDVRCDGGACTTFVASDGG